MDEVGPEVVPSVAQIRQRFDTKRRSSGSGIDRLLRKLLQLDLKMKQYVEGRVFVDEVVRIAGQDGFNQVWASPAHLPTTAEIADPKSWVDRVLAKP
jgi:putative hydrolase